MESVTRPSLALPFLNWLHGPVLLKHKRRLFFLVCDQRDGDLSNPLAVEWRAGFLLSIDSECFH